MSEHTPGPWHTIGICDYAGGARKYETLLVGGKNGGIADMLLHSDEQKFTAETNARLIAAAPEMKAALQRLLVKFKNCARSAGNSDSVIEDATAFARDALAKAEGKSTT